MKNKKQVFNSEKALPPIQTGKVPQNPYMAANNRSNMHCDVYMTDSYTCPGPMGKGFNGELYIRRYRVGHNLELCASLTFDSQGRIITVGTWPDEDSQQINHELLLVHPASLGVIASLELPSGGSGSSSFSSGGYIYLDQNDRAVVPLADGSIGIYQVDDSSGNPTFQKVQVYDPGLPHGSAIISALPDWWGHVWFATENGWVGFVDMNTCKNYKIQLDNDEKIANSFAVDETGGVFIASDHAMYRFDYDEPTENKIVQSWRCEYDRGKRIKPGQKSQGTGTTPTLLDVNGSAYVGITDNADPQMHVVVYRREKNFAGDRSVGELGVFKEWQSDTENSLIGAAGSYVVENNYGYTAKLGSAPTTQTTPGVNRVSFTTSSLSVEWNNETLSVPSVVSKVSIPDAVIYTYSLAVENQAAKWYFTGVNFYTGKVYYQKHTGDGANYDNHYSAVALHPDSGDAYIPVCGGIVRISNAPQ